MAQVGVRLLIVLAAAEFTGCASVPYRLDASAYRTDPILVTPGTRGPYGGPIWISLPEFALESGNPLALSISVPGSGIAKITLAMTVLGRLEAHIPPPTYDALARTPHPEEVLYEALKGEGGKLRFLQGSNTLAAKALAVTLAERLPRSTSNAWSDLYALDPALRSLALVPGMRLRLEGMLPVTADLERLSNERSQGSITAPGYLYMSPADDGTSASITLSPALRGLHVEGSSECNYDCPRWTDAGGLSSLISGQWRYWTALYPQKLGAVRGAEGPLQFVNEELLPTAGPPAVLLVAAASGADMAAFMARAREQQQMAIGSASVEAAKSAWRRARQALDAKANAAALTIETLIKAAHTDSVQRTEEGRAAVKALEAERAAYASLQREGDKVAIDCRLNDPPVAGCYVLRYRVLPVPEILVTVQGVQRWVEVGTTVGMVLAPHEPIRAARTLAGKYDSDVEAWRNAGARVNARGIGVHRLYRGSRHAIEVQPGSPADAVRNVVLQPGDEIEWSN